jgi:hypothetical protein
VNRLRQPLIIDVEASGLGINSYPIEVGVALADGTKFCQLIQPVESWGYWDDDAENVHHISRQSLHKNGLPVTKVAHSLNELLEDKVLYSDGWVVDKPWLTMLFHEAKLPMLFRVSPLEIILSEPQMALWHDTKDKVLAEGNIIRHRASNDAWVIQETYRRTLEATQTSQSKA